MQAVFLSALLNQVPNSYKGELFQTRKVHFLFFVQQLDELRRFKTLKLRTLPKDQETKPTSITSKTH